MLEYYAVAGVAQLVEQLIRNQQVTGSSPVTSSNGSILVIENAAFYFCTEEVLYGPL